MPRWQDVDITSLIDEAILDVADGVPRDLPVRHVLQIVLGLVLDNDAIAAAGDLPGLIPQELPRLVEGIATRKKIHHAKQ